MTYNGTLHGVLNSTLHGSLNGSAVRNAKDIGISDIGNYYVGQTVETALQESGLGLKNNTTELTAASASAAKGKTYGTLGARLDGFDVDTYLPITNLVGNGDFSNGATGWYGASATNISVSDGKLKVIATAQYGRAYTSIPNTVIGHMYYCSVVINGTANANYYGIYNHESYLATSGGRLSNVKTATSVQSTFSIGDNRTSGWTECTVDYVSVIDLTATFGAGNEPTVAQMDAMLSRFPNSWLAGTVNLFNAGYAQNSLIKKDTALIEKTGYGVYSGLAISAQATPNMTVSVPTGTIYMDTGARFTPTANTALAVSAADATNPRIDIVYVSYDGIISYLAGTAAASPSAPSIPTGGQLLAQIAVAAGATSITSTNITDKRRLNFQGAWITPTLLNGWTGNIKYAKSFNGFVTLAGEVTSGLISALSALCTMPDGYKPIYSTTVLATKISDASIKKAFVLSNVNGALMFCGSNELETSTQYRFQITYYAGS